MMKKLYILDDDSDFLEIVAHIFRKDYEVRTAQALDTEEIGSYRPDLILMDNTIGNDSSAGLIAEMHEKISFFTSPIILVSGHHNISSLATAKGIVGFIQKPASVQEIRACVADFFLSRSRA